jgi:hypothetical protein
MSHTNIFILFICLHNFPVSLHISGRFHASSTFRNIYLKTPFKGERFRERIFYNEWLILFGILC